jgi:hypothetical protein
VRENVDKGPVAPFHRPRNLPQRRPELRFHRGASRIEGEGRGDADDDSPTDAQDVEAHAGGLAAELALELTHIGRLRRRWQRPDLRLGHARGSSLGPADHLARQIGRADAERGEGRRAGHRRRTGAPKPASGEHRRPGGCGNGETGEAGMRHRAKLSEQEDGRQTGAWRRRFLWPRIARL